MDLHYTYACFRFSMVRAFVWRKWMALVKIDQATMEHGSMNAGIWILNSVAIIAPIYLLARLFTKMSVTSGLQGALIAFLIVFCFHHLPLMNANMFAGEPYGLAWITGGYSLTWLTVSGFILGAWKKVKS